MTFNPVLWRRVALVVAAINFVGAGVAIAMAEPLHASAHVALAVGFGWWAQYLRERRRDDEIEAEMRDTLQNPLERLTSLEGELTRVRQELSEVQERLDFAERILVQQRDKDRLNPGP